MTSKQSITKSEYHQLLGLRVIAKRHWDALNEIEKAAREITGEKEGHGHADDMMSGSRPIDEGLEILGIKVSE